MTNAEQAVMTKKKKKRTPFAPPPKPILPVPPPPPASEGPVFIAKFMDGVKTRMSIYSGLDPLDLKRAIAVSRAAYSSRTKTPMDAITTPIIEAHFETRDDGMLLASYDKEQIKGADK
jgi:hypothetical protein